MHAAERYLDKHVTVARFMVILEYVWESMIGLDVDKSCMCASIIILVTGCGSVVHAANPLLHACTYNTSTASNN